jgi:mRNA interferase MazF
VRGYVPESGDLIWLNFDPQAGREQGGHRPALILSPAGYNERAGLALACPITSHVKGYPFEVPISTAELRGVVLVDHVRSVDWRVRGAKKAGRAPSRLMIEVRDKLSVLLGFE